MSNTGTNDASLLDTFSITLEHQAPTAISTVFVAAGLDVPVDVNEKPVPVPPMFTDW